MDALEDVLNATTERHEDDGSQRQWVSSVDADTATLVSIASSAVILLSGAVAVVCLIAYMKRTEPPPPLALPYAPHALTCVKCGATVALPVASVVDARPLPPLTPTERPRLAPPPETALYAISAAVDDKSRADLGWVGVICGHVTDDQTTTYSTNCNDIHLRALTPGQRPPKGSSHSMCSSNQTNEELIRVFARNPLQFADEFESERDDTPTDPGIREFTGTPPRANERRQGVVERKPDDSESATTTASTTPTNTEYSTPATATDRHFGAIPRTRSRRPTWKLSSESQTMRIDDAFGLSSDDSSDDQQMARKESIESIHC